MHTIVFANLIPVIWEVVLQFRSLFDGGEQQLRLGPPNETQRPLPFLIMNILFTLIYTSEFLTKVGNRNRRSTEPNRHLLIQPVALVHKIQGQSYFT